MIQETTEQKARPCAGFFVSSKKCGVGCCRNETLLYIYDMNNAQHTNDMNNETSTTKGFLPGYYYTNGLSITQLLDEAQTLAFNNGCTAEGDAIFKNGTLFRQRMPRDVRNMRSDVRASVRHLRTVYRAAFAAGSEDATRIHELISDLTIRIDYALRIR